MRNKTKDKDVKILAHEVKYKGYFSIEEYKLKYKLFEGDWSREFIREVFERGQVAAVLPYDPLLNKVVLIEQFRIGALKDERSPWLLEVIAGVLNTGETHEQLAHRELQEEAGLEASELIPMYHYWVSPGGCTEHVKLFCGIVDSTQAGGIHGLAEEDEDIRVHVYEAKEAFQMVRDGMVTNALAIIALQWLELNYEKAFIQYSSQ